MPGRVARHGRPPAGAAVLLVEAAPTNAVAPAVEPERPAGEQLRLE
jgi:hypothetical protein